MKVLLPCMYSVVGVPRHGRVVSHFIFGEWVATDLRECSAEDAPVAVRCRVESDADVRFETRWYDDRHWARVAAVESVAPWLVKNVSRQKVGPDGGCGPAIARPLLSQLGYGYWWKQAYSDFVDGKARAFDPADFRELVSADDGEAARDAVRMRESCLVVDGELYVEVAEPRFVLEKCYVQNLGQDMAYRYVTVTPDRYDLISTWRYAAFRADREDDVCDYVRDWVGRENPVVRSKGEIEVLIPESINFDDERWSLLKQAESLVRPDVASLQWWQPGAQKGIYGSLRSQDRAYLLNWVDLRDEIARDDPDLDRVASLMEGLVGALPEGGHDRESTVRALQRWAVRPISAMSLRA